MSDTCQNLIQHTLLLDIEVNEKNEIYSLGGVLGEQTFQCAGQRRIDRQVLARFDAFCRDARFVLGHNISYNFV